MNTLIFDIQAVILGIGIIIFFVLSLKYGIKLLMLRGIKKIQEMPLRHVVGFTIEFLWVISFAFLIIYEFFGNNLIDNTSFGALVFRPLILLSSVWHYMSMRFGYYNELEIKKKIQKAEEATPWMKTQI